MVDLQCVWDDEADFLSLWEYCQKAGKDCYGLCRESAHYGWNYDIGARRSHRHSDQAQHFILFWAVISARRFWYGTMEMSRERTEQNSYHEGQTSATEIEFGDSKQIRRLFHVVIRSAIHFF